MLLRKKERFSGPSSISFFGWENDNAINIIELLTNKINTETNDNYNADKLINFLYLHRNGKKCLNSKENDEIEKMYQKQKKSIKFGKIEECYHKTYWILQQINIMLDHNGYELELDLLMDSNTNLTETVILYIRNTLITSTCGEDGVNINSLSLAHINPAIKYSKLFKKINSKKMPSFINILFETCR